MKDVLIDTSRESTSKDGLLCCNKINNKVIRNFSKVNLFSVIIPLLIIVISIISFIIFCDKEVSYVKNYINLQKDVFLYVNYQLSKYPSSEFNITQLGDVIVFFPLISIFILYAPKVWEALLTSSVISLIVLSFLKRLFAVPRPAGYLDTNTFVILGEKLSGATALPSGHSASVFLVITTLMFGFMPNKKWNKRVWIFTMITLGLFISFSRVAVGAHYPLDVIFGSIIGYTVTVVGIMLSEKLHIYRNKMFYPVSILLLIVWSSVIVQKILTLNLTVFYFSMISILLSIFYISRFYFMKSNSFKAFKSKRKLKLSI